ncbi:ABC transporter substrate-binding protein [Glaciibacter sp. 2TAF33]|uniref:ABC transporter substrate-binding protein n=1 Tax=Glaciibacter sp. 2TAF33 TaxID=3233015 RepID=UPI003F8FF263
MKTKMFHAAGFVAVSAVVALALGGCAASSSVGSTSSTSDSSCTLPSEIKLVAIKDQTGGAAFTGQEAWKGIQLAQDELNASSDLDGSKITIDLKDPAGVAQNAASQVSAAIADPDVAAILGPVLSDQGLAVNPIANKGKIPIIYTQAGTDGVADDQWNFRATPPLPTYFPNVGPYLKSKGAKTVGIIYQSDNPTLTQLGTKVIQDTASKNGFQTSEPVGVTATTQDFSGPISKLLSTNPDAVAMLVNGTQTASAVQQLQQAGFKGNVVTYPNGVVGLKAVGPAATGYVVSTNFDASIQDPAVQTFAAAFAKKFDGAVPSSYAAEGYDSLKWLGKAMADNGCASRDSIKQGLEAIGNEGFTGAQGKLAFVLNGHDARSDGVLVQWTGTTLGLVK